jgi:hypothetical protein
MADDEPVSSGELPDVDSPNDEDLPMFSTLMLAFGSLIVTVIVIWYALTNLKATSETIIALGQRGVANVSRLGNVLVNQTKVYALQSVPQIEQAAIDVFTSITNGVQSSFNSITSAAASLLQVTLNQFGKLALLVAEFGQQLTALLLQFLEPGFKGMLSLLELVQSGFDYTAAIYQAIADIVIALADSIS